jgi:hypothetical protein
MFVQSGGYGLGNGFDNPGEWRRDSLKRRDAAESGNRGQFSSRIGKLAIRWG